MEQIGKGYGFDVGIDGGSRSKYTSNRKANCTSVGSFEMLHMMMGAHFGYACMRAAFCTCMAADICRHRVAWGDATCCMSACDEYLRDNAFQNLPACPPTPWTCMCGTSPRHYPVGARGHDDVIRHRRGDRCLQHSESRVWYNTANIQAVPSS